MNESNRNVIFINPPVERIVEGSYDAPVWGHLGLAYVAAATRAAGIGCRVIDAKLARLAFDDVVAEVVRAHPAIVGITSFTHELAMAHRLAERIKAQLPDVRLVLGGVHASMLPLQTLKDLPAFDYLVAGEGERAFPALARALLDGREDGVPTIPGVARREADGIQLAPRDPWIEDLDPLPFPAWDLFPPATGYMVVATRGCPYKCVFCAHALGQKVRARSPENVIAEIRTLHENFRAQKVWFVDETFGLRKEWTHELCEGLVRAGLAGKFWWAVTTRAQVVTDEFVADLKRAGCKKIDIGVESGDERILKVIRKGETKEDFVRAVAIIKRAGLTSHAYFILGHPTETRESAHNTIDFAAQLNTDYVSIGIMIPYPGTEVAELASRGEGGYRSVSLNWASYNKQLGTALELDTLSRSDLTRLQLLGYLKFYLRNLKIRAFLSHGWTYRRLVFSMLKKLAAEARGRMSEQRP